jgi:O-methyltransferase
MSDSEFYGPLFKPELADEAFKRIAKVGENFTLLSPDRVHVLYSCLRHVVQNNLPGNIWECGTYRGGSAMVMAEYMKDQVFIEPSPRLVLFDTFDGMPVTKKEIDAHDEGDFSDTSAETVRSNLNHKFVELVKGFIPDTFKGRESERMSLAHIDVDIYDSVLACAEFIYPRVVRGGIIIFDDYGFPTCRGARKAVDEYFQDKKGVPIVLPTGQAIIFKSL